MDIPTNSLQVYYALSSFFYSIILKSNDKYLLGWESSKSQRERFRVCLEELSYLGIEKEKDIFSIFDVGCGYGALYKYLLEYDVACHYTGMDCEKECIDYAQRQYNYDKSTFPQFFSANLFDADVDVKNWGQYDLCFMSGVLNINIDKYLYAGAMYEVILFVIQKLLYISKYGVVCNFLHEKTSSKDTVFFYHNPERLVTFLNKHNIDVVHVRDDYLANDVTFVLKKATSLGNENIDKTERFYQKEVLPETLDIYTDGGCSGNPGVGAWAFVCPSLEGGDDFFQSGYDNHTTNNRMELMAALSAIKWLYIDMHANNKKTSACIHTDSQYLQKGMTEWVKKWVAHNWILSSGKSVQNRDLWENLIEYSNMCKQKNITITWKWVKGHDNNKYNEICHNLVTKEIKSYKYE